MGVPHRELGKLLRDMRVTAGLTMLTAAKLIARGKGTLQRLETGGVAKIEDEDLERLCDIYGRNDMLGVLKVLAAQGREPNWWQQFEDVLLGSFDIYVGLEATAQKLYVYRPDIISGLFQTPDYARALDRLYFAEESPTEIERRVRVRRLRQNRMTRRHSPLQVELIIDEGVLHRVVGGAKVMAAQCRYLADMPQNVSVRILPNSSGYPLGIPAGPLTILDFGVDSEGQPIEPAVVYVEGLAGDMYLKRPNSIRTYRRAFHVIGQVALNTAESKHLLRQVAKEYDRGHRPVRGRVVQE
ncbi:helix-turn-helix domain-containing protein [Nocardia sp. NPDC051570]|uniref:helix-turn-helix domain-containing protein n=1 Tax=Nocardia sp. NPDC051570 TaxID=3364324 RepID=UPI003798665D